MICSKTFWPVSQAFEPSPLAGTMRSLTDFWGPIFVATEPGWALMTQMTRFAT